MVQRDFKITNAALGEEIADENGRSVIKLTHQPVNPRELSDDSDDEFSSDDEDEELEEDEEIDMAQLKAAMNGKKGKKAAAEAEESEDDEEDEDFEEDATATAVVCSLIPGKIEQAQLSLVFVEGEVVMFEVTGKK
jgi:FK506-binding nuclear protein